MLGLLGEKGVKGALRGDKALVVLCSLRASLYCGGCGDFPTLGQLVGARLIQYK